MAHDTALEQRTCQQLHEIGKNIVYYRKQLGLTQERLAEMVDVSRPHLARIEAGIGTASLSLLFTICNKLDVPLKALFEFPNEN